MQSLMEASYLFTEEGSCQVQMIFFLTVAASDLIPPYNKHRHYTDTWQLPTSLWTWTTHDPDLCLHKRAYFTPRWVYSTKLMCLCLLWKWDITQVLHPFDCFEEGSLDKKRNPTPALFFLFQYEHVLPHPAHCRSESRVFSFDCASTSTDEIMLIWHNWILIKCSISSSSSNTTYWIRA